MICKHLSLLVQEDQCPLPTQWYPTWWRGCPAPHRLFTLNVKVVLHEASLQRCIVLWSHNLFSVELPASEPLWQWLGENQNVWLKKTKNKHSIVNTMLSCPSLFNLSNLSCVQVDIMATTDVGKHYFLFRSFVFFSCTFKKYFDLFITWQHNMDDTAV